MVMLFAVEVNEGKRNRLRIPREIEIENLEVVRLEK